MRAAVRSAEATAQTELLDAHVERLRALLADVKPIELDFEAAKGDEDAQPFDPAGLDREEPPPEMNGPDAPVAVFGKVMQRARARYEEELAEAECAYTEALKEHAEREERRKRMLAEAMAEHERASADVLARNVGRNRAVDGLRSRIDSGDPPALAAYFAAILAASDYPTGFPRKATVALDAAGRLLVVDYELPTLDAIPAAQAVRYDPRNDTFEQVPRPSARRKDLYALVVASVALRSVRELFDADRARAIDRVAFNGYVHGTDRSTGESVRPYLVSFRTSRDEFRLLDIVRTDPIVSMKTIEAAFSTNPAELAHVREVVGVRSLGTGAAMASSPAL
ncbi:MAG: hypothetical protein NVSMB57_06000 [Actinomycetota bacterium]